jgi:hypothetical protein
VHASVEQAEVEVVIREAADDLSHAQALDEGDGAEVAPPLPARLRSRIAWGNEVL